MRYETVKLSSLLRLAAVLAFAAVFIGSIGIPLTIPVSLLIALVFLIRTSCVQVGLPVLLLLGVASCGAVNLLLAGHVEWQRDYVIYVPIFYAIFVLLFVGGFSYGPSLAYAPLVGACLLSAALVFSFWQSFDSAAGYYQLKLHAETPLGRSNYLAVFIGFALLISTFWKSWFAVLLAPALFLTMSRSGILLVALFVLFRFLFSRKYWAVGVLVSALILLSFWSFSGALYDLLDLTLPEALSSESAGVRIEAWRATFEIIKAHPLVGIPRSAYKDALEAIIPGRDLWDPHNSILHLVVSFGLAGVVLYVSYVVLVYREICRAAVLSPFWRGVCWGYGLILSWSLFEPILLTPAVELLQAFLFVFARQHNTAAVKRTSFLPAAERPQAIT